MAFSVVKKLPSPEEVAEMIPFSAEMRKLWEQRNALIRGVIENTSDKFLLIIGPCSADCEEAVCDYSVRLAAVQDSVKDKLVIIPRVYTSKPRTDDEGYPGMFCRPDPNRPPDFQNGILAARRMHTRVLSESGLTAADEMLYPDCFGYISDLLGYAAVGARSVENRRHRLAASGLDIPVGMKNPLNGSLITALNAVSTARKEHNFIQNGYEVKTDGNPSAHIILRGWVSKNGVHSPNYRYDDLAEAAELYERQNLRNPMIVVDTNHSNSGKRYDQQFSIVRDVLESRRKNVKIRKFVRGLMVESYIVDGAQELSGSKIYGKSITDPCLGWKGTEELIYYLAERV
jgi:3-deoxy-7-phosphoheptulonate synthase